MKKINFHTEIVCDVRPQTIFRRPFVDSVYNGTERVSFLGRKIWEIVSQNIKTLESLNIFKKESENEN